MTEKDIKRADKDAHLTLRQLNVGEQNYQTFINDFVGKVHQQIKKEQSPTNGEDEKREVAS